VSMYAELLDLALGRPRANGEATKGEALAGLMERRAALRSGGSREQADDGVSGALADQLAYDSALIRLARQLGITCDPRDFRRPDRGRQQLEEALAARGIVFPEDP